MSRFQDPYLAESTGFATGHSNGIAQGVNIGRRQGHSTGYTEGWNAAAEEANRQLTKKDELIAELKIKLQTKSNIENEEIKKINADREELSKQIFALIDRIKLLRERHEETLGTLKKIKTIKHEEESNHKFEYEKKHMAFLGVAAIARSAMEIISQMTEKEKQDFLNRYEKHSINFQTVEYIDKNDFPHDQEIIKQYLPDIHEILNNDIIPKVISYQEKNNKIN